MDISNLTISMSIDEMALRIIVNQSHINVIRDILMQKEIIVDEDLFLLDVRRENERLFLELFPRLGDIDFDKVFGKPNK